jgi:hypothetical protein
MQSEQKDLTVSFPGRISKFQSYNECTVPCGLHPGAINKIAASFKAKVTFIPKEKPSNFIDDKISKPLSCT